MNSETPKNRNIVEEFYLWYRIEKGASMRELATDLGVTTALLYYWARHNSIPVRYLGQIEKLTDNVWNRHNLRPDLF